MKNKQQKLSNDNINDLLKYPNYTLKYQVKLDFLKDVRSNSLIFDFAVADKKNNQTLKPLMSAFSYYLAKVGSFLQNKHDFHVGLGLIEELTLDSLADIFRNAIQRMINTTPTLEVQLPKKLFKRFKTKDIANLFLTSLGMSLYPVDILKNKPSKEKIKLKEIYFVIDSTYKTDFKTYCKTFVNLSYHINGMRQVQSLPGNYFTAVNAEKRAYFLAKKYGLNLKVFKENDLKKMGAGGILAVNQGSSQEPRMLVLEYNHTKKNKLPTLALVGKGVTFDTGGISLKPSGDMHEMKYDMSGSGAVLHSIAAIAEAKIPIHAVGVVGMVENMPGASAIKPGDVYQSLKGHTVEIQNTDAEGRLVLGDLLTYADITYKPNLMIDLATLTGAIVVALGPFYAGLFSRHNEVINFLKKASEESQEPLWNLPLSHRYEKLLQSDIADYNNIGGRYGGSSSAASFLSVFVEPTTPWAHLDIAGIGFIKKPFNVYPNVATGYGIRLLQEVAESLANQKTIIS